MFSKAPGAAPFGQALSDAARRRLGGFVLPETMMAAGVIALLLLAVAGFTIFSARSFAALFNYVDLDDVNRIAIDQLTRDVRQSSRVKEATATKLVLEDADGSDLVYEYNPTLRKLTRTKNSVQRDVLTECDRFSFELGRRNTVPSTYQVYTVTTSADTAKVINVAWLCSRSLLGNKENTESVQTARIVIRKQGT